MGRTKMKTCTISGNKFSANTNNFYVNHGAPDSLHPYHKAFDNFRRVTNASVEQSKEERDAKSPKTYLGNVKVVWSNGNNVDAAPRDGAPAPAAAASQTDDLPF